MSRLLQRLLIVPRRHIGARILAGFVLITLLALLVALVSLANVATINRRLDETTRRDRQVVTAVLSLQLAVEQESDGVRGFLLSGLDRYLANFEAGAARFDSSIAQLERAIAHPDNLPRLESIRYREERFRAVAQQQIELHRQGWERSAIYLWGETGRERQEELLGEINDYTVWQDELIGDELRQARDSANLAILIALSLVGLAGLISAMVSLVLTRSITRPIRALARVANTMKSGNLDVRVPVMGVDEIGTLAQTIEQMASSLKQSRRSLEASLIETEQRNRELTTLNTVAAAAASLDLQPMLSTTLARVLDLTGVEGGGIHLRDADGVLRPVTQSGLSPRLLEPAALENLTRSLETGVAAHGHAVTYHDDMAEPGDVIAMMRAAGIQSAVSVPLTSQGQVVGVLSLASHTGRRFDARAIDLLTSIGNQIGIAVENASLLLQREQRITTLSVINEVSRAISAVLDLDHLYAVLYDQCRRLLDAPGFSIALWDDDAEALVPGLLYVDGQRVDTAHGWPSEPPLMALVARERRPLLTDDYQGTCRALGIQPYTPMSADGPRAYLAVPMTIGDRLVGVMTMTSTSTTYSAEDQALLAAIANQAAVAIENARLYQQTRELGVIEERNRLAREIHDTIAQGLTGIVLQLEAASTLMDGKPERARQRIGKATELARNSLVEARRSVWNLRPAPLEERALADAIAAEASRLGEEGLSARCRVEGDRQPLAPEIENGVYRIAQEALQNIRKHARAATVDVTLAWLPDLLTLTIHDDGQGFDPDNLSRPRPSGGGFGLLGMRERARLIGGNLDIHSTPGEGTVLEVKVPLASHAGIPKPTQPATPTATRALIP